MYALETIFPKLLAMVSADRPILQRHEGMTLVTHSGQPGSNGKEMLRRCGNGVDVEAAVL